MQDPSIIKFSIKQEHNTSTPSTIYKSLHINIRRNEKQTLTMTKTTTPSSSSSRPSSTIVIAGLYLLLVAPFSSAQPSQCPPIEYCGGDHGYPESEISCTAFPARFDASGESWYDAACGHPNISLLTGGDPYGAKAWRDSGKKDDHYWVFHGCDKAGTSE